MYCSHGVVNKGDSFQPVENICDGEKAKNQLSLESRTMFQSKQSFFGDTRITLKHRVGSEVKWVGFDVPLNTL